MRGAGTRGPLRPAPGLVKSECLAAAAPQLSRAAGPREVPTNKASVPWAAKSYFGLRALSHPPGISVMNRLSGLSAAIARIPRRAMVAVITL